MRIMDKYRTNLFSQNGEDGLLDEVFKRIGIKKGSCAEFGAADGKYCSNTMYFIQQGWNGWMAESGGGSAKALIDNTMAHGVRLYFGEVKTDNINELLPKELNLLSIDIDNWDYHVWEAYTSTPDAVVIEINSSVAPGIEMTPGTKGASYTSMVRLGVSKGYFVICHTGNLIFVLNKHRGLFPEIIGDGLSNAELYFDKSWL